MKKLSLSLGDTLFHVATTGAAVWTLAALPAAAREISPDEAGQAAAAWVRRDRAPLGAVFASAAVAEVRTATDGGTPIFHVVRMAGGGVVVTSAESGVTPVIAFLDGDDIQEVAGNPLWEILNADMAQRTARVRAVHGTKTAAGTAAPHTAASLMESRHLGGDGTAAAEAGWAELLGEKGNATLMGTGIFSASDISDLRVPALLASSWGQSGGAANYYTPPYAAGDPTNYVCGCVALAGAQIARHWQFPTEPRPQTNLQCYVVGVTSNCTTMGGLYDWANMPDNFTSLTVAQKQAVGHLCYDFGVATQMDWGTNESSTVSLFIAEAFRDVFGYANAIAYAWQPPGGAVPDDIIGKAILANLDAGCPVALGIKGHAVVADGYGYQANTLYTHLNMGWGGLANAWYNLPDVESVFPSYTSTVLDQLIFNIFPSVTGDLLTGRVLDSIGNPVAGAAVAATSGGATVTGTTNERGIYALHVAGGRAWNVSATHGAESGSRSAYVASSFSAIVIRTATTSSVHDLGYVGNVWGNDITLGVDAPTPPTLADAVDNAALTFTTGGEADWFAQSDESHDGTDAARSGPVVRLQSTWMETAVSGPGTLSFWWRVSSEADWDWFSLSVDGEQEDRISGTNGAWEQKTVHITGDGAHTVRWEYAKDHYVTHGSDCAWVDQVVWTPGELIKPAWAEQADSAHFWAWVDANRVADYASCDYTAQYLLNVAPSQTPVNFRIDGIEVVAGSAMIRVVATAGRSVVDLTKLNGVLCVAVGSSVDSLTPKAIPSANVKYNDETHVATIVIPEADGAIVQARIDFTAPASSLAEIP
ncbi:MAG: C10 family peptidase [Kiritimatiellae bacterium]|nr:C10 family peptidase [Kiritimatiellia bacterium]